MSIPQKKQFWKIKSAEGATTPKKLWKAACEYFNWCDNNPLNEEKLFHYQGNVSKENISKMRAYTLTGLCLYIDCSTAYLETLKTTEGKHQAEFVDIINRIEEAIYTQQLTGAASDQLNATIVAKNLGLASKTDLTTNGEPINNGMEVSGMTTEDLKKIAEIRDKYLKR